MDFILNILTLSLCSATMAYCYVLSKRISSFRNMKDGIGALIEEMIRTTTELQTAFEHTKHHIEKQSNAIQDKIDEGSALSEYLSNVLVEIQEIAQQASYVTNHKTYQSTSVQRNQYMPEKQPYFAPQQEHHKLNTVPASHHQSAIRNKHSFNNASSTSQDENPYTLENDPLADVMPAGFEQLFKNRQSKRKYSNEEYL